MEKEHTPAVTTPDRTAFRFTRIDVIDALTEYVNRSEHGPVPEGRVSVVLPRRDHPSSDDWTASLCVTHDDPPPTGKDVKDD